MNVQLVRLINSRWSKKLTLREEYESTPNPPSQLCSTHNAPKNQLRPKCYNIEWNQFMRIHTHTHLMLSKQRPEWLCALVWWPKSTSPFRLSVSLCVRMCVGGWASFTDGLGYSTRSVIDRSFELVSAKHCLRDAGVCVCVLLVTSCRVWAQTHTRTACNWGHDERERDFSVSESIKCFCAGRVGVGGWWVGFALTWLCETNGQNRQCSRCV